MRPFKIALSAVMLTAVTAAFFGAPTETVCRLQPAATWVFLLVLLLTFAWGRLFCETMCPLGVLQTLVNWIFHPKTNVRRVCSRLPRSRVQHAVNAAFVVLALAFGWAALNPYGIFGRALSLWIPGLAVLGVILLLAAFGRGRFWCNWVCPFGTVFNLISKAAWRKEKVGRHCANCRKCFAREREKTGEAGDGGGVTRRETLKGVAVLAVAEKLTDGGYAPVSLPGSPERTVKVLPPGVVGPADDFARKCVGCQLCVRRCPGHCLKPSAGWKDFGTVKMDFREGYCLTDCTACSTVCPAGALEPLEKAVKRNVHIGTAVWHRDLCLRTTKGESCTACSRKCPRGAIHVVEGIPVVDADACIGCGACEHVCPARPLPAISVVGLEVQRKVRPIGEADLVAEMKRLVGSGASIVVARSGIIVRREEGRGIGPALRVLDEGVLFNATVADKVVGRAAAAVFVIGGVKKVFAQVMSDGARKMLSDAGVAAAADTYAKAIENREKTGSCPMELAVADIDNPAEMVAILRRKVK